MRLRLCASALVCCPCVSSLSPTSEAAQLEQASRIRQWDHAAGAGASGRRVDSGGRGMPMIREAARDVLLMERLPTSRFSSCRRRLHSWAEPPTGCHLRACSFVGHLCLALGPSLRPHVHAHAQLSPVFVHMRTFPDVVVVVVVMCVCVCGLCKHVAWMQ